jgi:DNA mismatch repair protein MSH3
MNTIPGRNKLFLKQQTLFSPQHYVDFRAAVQALAALDCLHSLAILSQNQGYVRPLFVSQEEPPQLRIVGGRHPVLEATLKDNFVPNDTCLLENGERCQIITGPNMGGKSVYIRQVALIVIMAQVRLGCYPMCSGTFQ